MGSFKKKMLEEESDHSDQSDVEEEEESSVKGENYEDMSESEEEQSEEDEEEVPFERKAQANRAAAKMAPIASATGEPCTFDLRNLLAINTHQISSARLYSKSKAKGTPGARTIDPLTPVDEEYLLEKATDGCAQLVTALWQLPIDRSDAGPMVTLPSYDDSKLPRALPPPEPKKETKWEKFAKEKGIALNKNKRSQKVWDETTGDWGFRHGFNKAGGEKQWPIMEVKANQDPYADPWEVVREEKKKRVDKNMENRMRNQERAGVLTKGATNKTMKNLERTRVAGKEGGNKDRDLVLPSGVPVDLKPGKASGDLTSKQRGKESTLAALKATQRSTASLGKFDKMREGEPERKKALAGLKRRKFESATDKKVIQSETERSMKLFKSMSEGGSVEKERARKKGRLAHGETAYDYDFDDGLGPSSFRKKKGRAGVGKAKKMTKKRAK